VKKSEIMAAMCEATRKAEAGLNAVSEEGAAYKRHLAAQLERRLRQIEPEIDIQTCADFPHLEVKCCPVCHNECPDELEIIEIESGGRAWLCCSLDRALNPSKHAAMEASPEWQELIRATEIRARDTRGKPIQSPSLDEGYVLTEPAFSQARTG
jgi:hypothetical protein